MAIARSKLTAKGQISVPAEVRKRLGVGPGSIIEWDDSGDQVIVRCVGAHSSADVHAALFATEKPKSTGDVKAGIRKHLRRKHARG